MNISLGDGMTDSAVIVIGAGPVGMLAALLAAHEGIPVIILEKSRERSVNSRAIGVTPPSLEILQRIGLHGKLISRGIKVEYSEAHDRNKRLGKLMFSKMKSEFQFILSVPQDQTESILEEALLSIGSIRFYRGYNVKGLVRKENLVEVSGCSDSGAQFQFTASCVIACDGGKSTVRQILNIPFDGSAYRETFLMADYEDNTGWGSQARLYFTSRGSVESFPMAGSRRRYVVRTPFFMKENSSDYLQTELYQRSGVDVSGVKEYWESGFGVQRFLARSFGQENIFLCGDAAHLMTPIGGQNMNTGFADAELAVWLVQKMLEKNVSSRKVMKLYNRVRRRAANSAAWRAEFMMRVGTSGGGLWSAFRNLAIRLFLHTPVVQIMAAMFCMLSIPYRNLESSRIHIEKELH